VDVLGRVGEATQQPESTNLLLKVGEGNGEIDGDSSGMKSKDVGAHPPVVLVRLGTV
jgi:hypothetical protein